MECQGFQSTCDLLVALRYEVSPGSGQPVDGLKGEEGISSCKEGESPILRKAYIPGIPDKDANKSGQLNVQRPALNLQHACKTSGSENEFKAPEGTTIVESQDSNRRC